MPPPPLPRTSFIGFLPLVCAGLALFGSFPSSFATALLPRLIISLEILQELVPADADATHEAHDLLEDFELGHGIFV
eukprot:scaffold158407_cov24-Tisochrysis_lutea.AAC.1